MLKADETDMRGLTQGGKNVWHVASLQHLKISCAKNRRGGGGNFAAVGKWKGAEKKGFVMKRFRVTWKKDIIVTLRPPHQASTLSRYPLLKVFFLFFHKAQERLVLCVCVRKEDKTRF